MISLKRPTDYNPCFSIVTVRDFTKTSRAIVVCPLGTFNCFERNRSWFSVCYKIKISCCVFDYHRVKVAKNIKFLIPEHSHLNLK